MAARLVYCNRVRASRLAGGHGLRLPRNLAVRLVLLRCGRISLDPLENIQLAIAALLVFEVGRPILRCRSPTRLQRVTVELVDAAELLAGIFTFDVNSID